jgi:hypothetical protein
MELLLQQQVYLLLLIYTYIYTLTIRWHIHTDVYIYSFSFKYCNESLGLLSTHLYSNSTNESYYHIGVYTY